MAAPKPNQLLYTLIFLSIILNIPVATISQECPYPCYPPPTGTVNNPTPPSTIETPPSQTASYPPPPAFFYPPPSGYLPFSPPFIGNAPPPPDPIVPWFPYYYRKPPHQSDQSSSSTALQGSTVMISIAYFFGFLGFFLIL
ncbi:hypothetical protein TEA_020825 [Camellia sinensis var. sinensis]|uniref:Uncharacterized protein n=1 Tax=Camellia sinensis var. sinensis TaxID=542762 RepID=A0A4S4EYA6_CAMSN|nr:hypothetical protein TEA_020825 [Camellia sinensis var. sinensis]